MKIAKKGYLYAYEIEGFGLVLSKCNTYLRPELDEETCLYYVKKYKSKNQIKTRPKRRIPRKQKKKINSSILLLEKTLKHYERKRKTTSNRG